MKVFDVLGEPIEHPEPGVAVFDADGNQIETAPEPEPTDDPERAAMLAQLREYETRDAVSVISQDLGVEPVSITDLGDEAATPAVVKRLADERDDKRAKLYGFDNVHEYREAIAGVRRGDHKKPPPTQPAMSPEQQAQRAYHGARKAGRAADEARGEFIKHLLAPRIR